MLQTQHQRRGTLWFVGDGLIHDAHGWQHRQKDGRPLECSSKLLVFNPQRRPVAATARFYHTDHEPTEARLALAPQRVSVVELSTLEQVPHQQPFWVAVEAEQPVLPQLRHEDYTFWEQTPDALISVQPYPGPLTDETWWIFPDCYQGGTSSWHEQEILTILNPGSREASVKLLYFPRGRDGGAEEVVRVGPRRVAGLRMWERCPTPIGRKTGPIVRLMGDYAIHLRASRPVIAQITRRARWRGFEAVVGARGVIAQPWRPRERHRVWHYPGGAIVDSGVLPRGENFDVTWNLLFTHNPQENRAAEASIGFHNGQGTVTQSQPIRVAPRQSNLQWLHLAPWLGRHTRVDEPFGLTVRADGAVLPAVTHAEFEMFSRMCPGAMGAANLYPGPLTVGERTWWLGIGPAGGRLSAGGEAPCTWEQAWHLLNPGPRAANVTLHFLGLSKPYRHELRLAARGAVRVVSAEVAGLPAEGEMAVRAEADQAICAQTVGRCRTTGTRPTKAMYCVMGTPMKLGGAGARRGPAQGGT